MKALLALLMTIGLALPAQAQVASADECYLFMDMALVARALAKSAVEEPVARNIVADVYNLSDERVKGLADAVLKAAYASKQSPQDFAVAFGTHCTQNAGKMEKFFGVGI